MRENLVRRKIAFMAVTVLLFLGLLGVAQATITVIQQLNWNADPIPITVANQFGNNPSLLVAPNGDLMIVYSQWTSSAVAFSNPYFSMSMNEGQTWSSPASILTTGNPTSQVFVSGAYDALNVAHVAWVDFTSAQPPNFPQSRVFYARRQGTSWTTPVQLAERTNSPIPIELVDVVATGTQTLDMVWNEEERLVHRRSTDGGVTWSNSEIIAGTNAVANKFKLSADVNGVVYLVWEQRTPGVAGGPNIFFSQLVSGLWSTPLLISADDDEENRATFPSTVVSNSSVHVAYAYRQIADQETSPMFVVTKRCPLTADCTDLANWSSRTSLPPRMFVNSTEPFFIVPDMAYDDSLPAVHLYYHGIPAGGDGQPIGNNEAIYGRDSCQEWLVVDQATETTVRSIKPALDARNGRLYLAYEQVSSVSGNTRISIFYKRADFARDDGGSCAPTPTPPPSGGPTTTPSEPTITPAFTPVPTITPSPVPRGDNDVYLPSIAKP